MPTNPYKDEFEMRKDVDMFVLKKLPKVEKQHYGEFILNVLLTYPVSEKKVMKFIEDNYLDKYFKFIDIDPNNEKNKFMVSTIKIKNGE